MEDLDSSSFYKVLLWASLISLCVFWVFAIFGEHLLIDFLSIKPEALRIFGGVIFAIVGYNYVMKGSRATEILRGSIEELPSEIALPFMIGAGTITQSILIGKNNTRVMSISVILISLAVSYIIVIIFRYIRVRLNKRKEGIFDKYVNIFSRINGLIIGAVSIDMIVSGIHKLWQISS